MATVEDLTDAINKQGEAIRELKTNGATGDVVKQAVAQLLELKENYSLMAGKPFDPPKATKPKKEAAPAPAAEDGAPKGPSKKELAKLAKKDAKSAAKAAKAAGGESAAPSAAAAPAAASVAASPAVAVDPGAPVPQDEVRYGAKAVPTLTAAAASLAGLKLRFCPTGGDALPCLVLKGGQASVSGDHAIARHVLRAHGRADLLAPPADPLAAAHVDQWLDACLTHAADELAAPVERHLALSTFLAGHQLTIADVAVFAKLGAAAAPGAGVERWRALMASLPEVTAALNAGKGVAARATAEKAGGRGGSGKGGGGGGASASAAKQAVDTSTGGALPPLDGAVEGQVCTRFPPEPSGYLHIGHVKACLLNEYYARRYKGRLLIRFDDTNPAKEKGEYEDAIIQDLATLGIVGDAVSYTSDFFAELQAYAERAITEGWAYMDDTPQEQMQAERLELKESARRGAGIEENMKLFKALCAGEPGAEKWCLRARIDMKSVNGTMRDPVIYRANPLPHHRTGTKWKAYPTYDFACPIVDSVEGVTHALRTTEYNDRDEQYAWLQAKLKLRPTKIHGFARMNFVRTVLSKRKLTWFVNEGLVDGWFDPRFPTVQGVMRRGVSVAALREFILSQGASRRITTMQWDKFWATNKAQYEPTAPRFMGVFRDGAVPLTLTNVPAAPAAGATAISVPVHPKDASMGQRPMRIGPVVLLEGADAAATAEGERITLMRWGVVTVTSVTRDEATGVVTALTGALDAAGDHKGTRKLNWLARCADLVPASLVEFDYLITKEKLEEGDDVKDHLTPVTRAASDAFVDPLMRGLCAGDVVQLERRGFFRVDAPYGGGDAAPLVLFMIPDGKTAAMSTLTSALNHV